MPSAHHFGKLLAEALSDPRILRASELYVAAKLAKEDTALATVLGHVTMLGLWASRESDEGAIPGDGVSVVSAATISSPSVARKVVAVLRAPDVDLITGADGTPNTLRLRGFRDAYGSIITKRQNGAIRTQRARERNAQGNAGRNTLRDVVSNAGGTEADKRRGEEINSPPPPGGGFVGPAVAPNGNGHPEPPRKPTPEQVRSALAMAAVIRNERDVAQDRREDAKALEKRILSNDATAEDVEAFARRHYHDTDARIAYLSPP